RQNHASAVAEDCGFRSLVRDGGALSDTSVPDAEVRIAPAPALALEQLLTSHPLAISPVADLKPLRVLGQVRITLALLPRRLRGRARMQVGTAPPHLRQCDRSKGDVSPSLALAHEPAACGRSVADTEGLHH